jgi:hypothetical protein
MKLEATRVSPSLRVAEIEEIVETVIDVSGFETAVILECDALYFNCADVTLAPILDRRATVVDDSVVDVPALLKEREFSNSADDGLLSQGVDRRCNHRVAPATGDDHTVKRRFAAEERNARNLSIKRVVAPGTRATVAVLNVKHFSERATHRWSRAPLADRVDMRRWSVLPVTKLAFNVSKLLLEATSNVHRVEKLMGPSEEWRPQFA